MEGLNLSSAVVFLILRIGLAVALFAFLGWALWLQWHDLREQAQTAARPPAPPINLAQIVDGDETEARTYRFNTTRITIGRDPACECRLDDKTISGRHAKLLYQMEQWWIEDLGSTNGTFLNQDQVKSPLVITTGDQLRFGQLIFQMSIETNDKKGEL
jgi:hypothetical protein